jgi:hypothetical protein
LYQYHIPNSNIGDDGEKQPNDGNGKTNICDDLESKGDWSWLRRSTPWIQVLSKIEKIGHKIIRVYGLQIYAHIP